MIGIDPLTPILTLRPRYLSPFFPFAICFVAIFLWRVFSKNILDRERPLLLTFTAGLLIIFVVSTKYETCAWESTEINWSGSPRVLFKKTYCGMFRYLNNQNIVPTSPTFFIFKADQFYREFGKDFRLGRVAVPGGGLAPLYEILMRHNMREIEMHKTRSDHYSIYGKTKEYCVDDLGRYKNSVADNYYECSSIGKRVDDTSYINFTRLGLRSGEN